VNADAGVAGGSPSALLRAMVRIRAFEDHLLSTPDPGFQLLSSGEEAVAVGVCAVLEPGDQLLSSGRAIGPALARGIGAGALLAELLGKRSGPCKGKAGRGHVSQPAVGFFGAHAVVGGNIAVAAGVALAQQHQGGDRMTVCMFGDGACGAGILHETMNMATLWRLPLVFVCNNNQYSVSTSVRQALAPTQLADLARPFGIPATTVDGMDVCAVREAMVSAAAHARSGSGPAFVECISYRFQRHSTSSRESRPRDEILAWQERCPIKTLASRFDLDLAETRAQIDDEMAEAIRFALASPMPLPADALEDVGS
jgi:TPP-dependent pyruvate/acetoin dehydrogenase alpha subunit